MTTYDIYLHLYNYNYCLHVMWTSKVVNQNVWYRKYNDGTGLKKGFPTYFRVSGVVDWATTYCFPLYYIYLGCSPGCLPREQISRNTFKWSYYFHIVKYYVRYNNIHCLSYKQQILSCLFKLHCIYISLDVLRACTKS